MPSEAWQGENKCSAMSPPVKQTSAEASQLSWMLSSRPTQKLFILHDAVSVDVNATVRKNAEKRASQKRCRLWGGFVPLKLCAAGTWPWHTMIWFLFTQPDAAMGQHFINDDPRGALALRGVQAPHHLLLDMPGQLTFHNPSLTGMNVSWRYLIYYAHYAH